MSQKYLLPENLLSFLKENGCEGNTYKDLGQYLYEKYGYLVAYYIHGKFGKNEDTYELPFWTFNIVKFNEGKDLDEICASTELTTRKECILIAFEYIINLIKQ